MYMYAAKVWDFSVALSMYTYTYHGEGVRRGVGAVAAADANALVHEHGTLLLGSALPPAHGGGW
jgi:hypothetical protein